MRYLDVVICIFNKVQNGSNHQIRVLFNYEQRNIIMNDNNTVH